MIFAVLGLVDGLVTFHYFLFNFIILYTSRDSAVVEPTKTAAETNVLKHLSKSSSGPRNPLPCSISIKWLTCPFSFFSILIICMTTEACIIVPGSVLRIQHKIKGYLNPAVHAIQLVSFSLLYFLFIFLSITSCFGIPVNRKRKQSSYNGAETEKNTQK